MDSEAAVYRFQNVDATGAAAAWVDAVEVFGSGKLGVADILEPAIRLAEEGYIHWCYRIPKRC